VRLTVLPGASEALVCGAFATVIFGMHLTLGLSLGFILGAVSPAVVGGGAVQAANPVRVDSLSKAPGFIKQPLRLRSDKNEVTKTFF
jgi:NhaP-type Na+/H+ or K+/H+ antiporter